MSNNYKGWYVVCVKSYQEKKVFNRLVEKGIQAFLPLVKSYRIWSDRKKLIMKPLFPSYIMVNITSREDFHLAITTNGVFKFVQFEGKYAKVKEFEINRIKRFLNIEALTEVETTHRMPRLGEEMQIEHGPLQGMKCIITRINNKNKIFASIKSLKCCLTAVIPVNYLKALPA